MKSLGKQAGLILPFLITLLAVSCHLDPAEDPPPEESHLLNLKVPDSLADYDTVRVRLVRDGDTVETLWNAPLPEIDSLESLKTETYGGGRIDVLVEGLRQGDIQYRVLVRVMGGGSPHEVERLSLPADQVPPILTLKGLDSLRMLAGEPYEDSGATCRDVRDGDLDVEMEGSVPIFASGTHILVYRCEDAAGNAADSVVRKVRVDLPPDSVPPRITLRGKDSLTLHLGSSYTDSGAVCRDGRDGDLEPTVEGSVKTDSVGRYSLVYRCEDAAGNTAETIRRTVRVEAPPDTTPAVMALKGPATIEIWVGGTLSDTGATCIHPVRGGQPVATEGRAALDTPGVYTLRYTCEVRAGWIEAVSQDVRVKPIRTEIPIHKEAEIDTARNTHQNMGYNASGAFLPSEGNEHVILMQFDLSQVKLEGLKSAEAVFQTFGNGDWTGDPVTATLHVYRVRSAWTEGTGNWFWHAGGWRNNGATIFKHYPLSDSVMAKSTDPGAGGGVTGAQKSLVRKSNMISMGTRQVTVAYASEESFHPGAAGFVPPKELLTPLSVDFTDYVKTVTADQDFGFVIVVEDLPPPLHISWLTKEAGDGSFGAKLVLKY